jgi:hypothetical protein
MSTTYLSKAYHVDVVAWTPFVPKTGVGSNIDGVITACDAANVVYIGGTLYVRDTVVAPEEFVGKDGAGRPTTKTPTEIDTEFTED